MDHRRILDDLAALVRDTYQLWDQEWVGFTWRNYTFEHVQRVRALALSLARSEGADPLVVDYAGLLHDITKGYDGEIILKDGQRHLDENGHWRNEVLPPARRNEVVDLYESLGLAGMLHNESGALIADALLAGRDLPPALRARVAAGIRAHLRPGADAPVEERVLYDADTIDANIGLPALHRNLYINLHREEAQRPDFREWIGPRRVEFLRWYLGERVPTWINTRRPEFLARLTTAAGRRIGAERYDRLLGFVASLLAELPEYERASRHGGLAVVGYLIDNRANPRLSQQVAHLAGVWRKGEAGLARSLVEAFDLEMKGLQ